MRRQTVRRQSGRLRPWRLAAPALCMAALAACGTRLPDSAFGTAGSGVSGGTGASTSASGAAGGAGSGSGTTTAGSGAGGGSGSTPSAGGQATGSAGAAGSNGSAGLTTAGSASGGGASGTASRGHAAHGSAPVTGGTANTASAPGVTPTSIVVGNITSKSNPFGPGQFIPNFLGAQAYFDDLDAHGGVNGRTISMVMCDDQADPTIDESCAHTLIQSDKVFALVANNIYDYAAAPYVSSSGVPDIGSEPVDPAYFKYPGLFDVFGEQYVRNGTAYGQDGDNWGTAELWEFFRQRYHVDKIGVVYYDEQSSQVGAEYLQAGGEDVGDSVVMEPVNLALPDYTGVVNDMKSQGVQAVFDALDESGNAKLCQAMDDAGWTPVAKVETSADWSNDVASLYADSPKCRNILFASAPDEPFNSTSIPIVAQFRRDMATYEGQAEPNAQLAIWAEEGYAGAMWFTDAVRSCGADVTRACVEHYMLTVRNWDGDGLVTPRDFRVIHYHDGMTQYHCVAVVQWQDADGGWVERGDPFSTGCYTTRLYSFPDT